MDIAERFCCPFLKVDNVCRQEVDSLVLEAFQILQLFLKERICLQILPLRVASIEKECKYFHATIISLEGVSIPL